MPASSLAQSASPNGVRTLSPPELFKPEGTWSLGTRAGDFVFVAGMPGIDSKTKVMVADPEAQVRQTFVNIKAIAEAEGATLRDCLRITVYVSDLTRIAPLVDKAQAELWGPALPAAHIGRGETAVRRHGGGNRKHVLRTEEMTFEA